MTLGRGLESLIPPQPFDGTQGKQPFDSNKPPQENLEEPAVGNSLSELGLPDSSGRTSSPRSAESDIKSDTKLSETARGSVREIPTADPLERGVVFQIETDKILPNPHQPRRNFDEVGLRELANSIREFGIIQPLVVSKLEKESPRGWEVSYELIAGERRLMAAKSLGLRTVPAIIRQVPVEHEKLELAVTENVQRSNLNPIEFARAIAKLQEDFKLTQREVAARLGKSREAIANTLRLLGLPSDIQEAVAKGIVSESQARLLLSIEDASARDRLFREILNNNLTVREVNLKVRQLKGKPVPEDAKDGPTIPSAKAVDPELLTLKEELEVALGAPVELKSEGEGGKLTINFYSKEELEGILARFRDRQTP